jgi:DNA-binding NtrC family response regulator
MFYRCDSYPSRAAACLQTPPPFLNATESGQEEMRGPLPALDILTISADDGLFDYIASLVRGFGWSVIGRGGCRDAAEYLSTHAAAVAITASELPDGDWKDVICALRAVSPHPPSIVVVADWKGEPGDTEVITRGGFDTLECPFDKCAVVWTIASAWHRWMKTRERAPEGSRA